MLECIILGDSIAVGTQMFAKECQLIGKGGINSWQWNQMYQKPETLSAKAVIISLGTNDHKYIKTYDELFAMRQRVDSNRVFWILPMGNLKASEVPIEKLQATVREVAQSYGDVVIETKRMQPDGIHPSWAGYKELVEQTK